MAATDIADKVAKLLSLAERTENPLEAQAFTEKAEELMLRYNIDEAVLASKTPGTKTDPIVMEKFPVSGQYAAALVTYGFAVAPSFNLKAYQTLNTGTGATSYVWLVGHQSDVEQGATLLRSLLIQAESAQKHWWKNEGSVLCAHLGGSKKYAARREFYFAFASGARSRLSEVFNRVVNEAGTGTDLVLVDRKKLVDDWTRANVRTSASRAGRTQAGDYSARVAGHAAGRDAVGSKAIR